MANNIGVHAAHCCKFHGCKYGDEDCPVVTGEVKQLYICESCEYELEGAEYFIEVVNRLDEIKQIREESRKRRFDTH